MIKVKPVFKVWFETEEGYVFGQGIFDILQKIQEVGNIRGAAQALEMSYRHAWGIIRKAERRIGEALLETRRGGKFGGGGAELTQVGHDLIKEFVRIQDILSSNRKDELFGAGIFTKISARNLVEGEVISIEKGKATATVKIKIDVPCTITSFITREAVEDLKIEKGERVVAVVKSTEVEISKK